MNTTRVLLAGSVATLQEWSDMVFLAWCNCSDWLANSDHSSGSLSIPLRYLFDCLL